MVAFFYLTVQTQSYSLYNDEMSKNSKTVNHYMGEPGTLIDYYNYSIINLNVCFNILYTHHNMISGVWAPE